MARRDEIIVGLDVGTTKVTVVVGEVKEGGGVDVIGVGQSASVGMKRGVVVDVAETTSAISRAVHEAETMAGCTVNAVYIGASGQHLRSINNGGVINVVGGQVREEDVERVTDNARAVPIPADRVILHTVPQEFLVDGNDGIRQPVGINGVRLQARVHIIHGLGSVVENVRQCVEGTGLHVLGCYAELMASAAAVLEPDERDLGVALVDIGGGTTDVAIFHNGFIVHSAVLPFGGDLITQDIAYGLRSSRAEAERVKLRHGCALPALVDEEETFEVACVGGRDPIERKRTLLCDIIEPRVSEIYNEIAKEIARSNFAEVLGSGVVVTGGTALLPGMAELGDELLSLPVRLGRPRLTGGLFELVKAPAYSTAVGLVLLGAESAEQARRHRSEPARQRRPGWRAGLTTWLSELFD
jgi:cell division protein FtsA